METRSTMKNARVWMSTEHGADKAVNPRLKPEAWVKREGMTEPCTKPPTQSQTILHSAAHRMANGRSIEGMPHKITSSSCIQTTT